MRTLHAYLVRQILASLLMTVAVFTFVLVLGSFLKEVLPYLVNRQVAMGTVLEAVGLLIPFVWVFALPMGMLTATLLIFGRFSADQELTAVRASGISLLSLISPILLLSLALCALSAWMNTELGPRSRVIYTNLIYKIRLELSNALLPEDRYIKDFPGYVFYIGKNQHQDLEDVVVYKLATDTNNSGYTYVARAPRGHIDLDPTNKLMTVHLFDAKMLTSDGMTTTGDPTITLDFNFKKRSEWQPKIDDMTIDELWDQYQELERLTSNPATVRNLTTNQIAAKHKELAKQHADLTRIQFQIHRQVAFSFACFGFTLVGIPLGIRVQRRETNIGIMMALLLVAVYYSFVLLAASVDTRPEWAPHLIVWLPNFVFQGVGAVLLWRANRGI